MLVLIRFHCNSSLFRKWRAKLNRRAVEIKFSLQGLSADVFGPITAARRGEQRSVFLLLSAILEKCPLQRRGNLNSFLGVKIAVGLQNSAFLLRAGIVLLKRLFLLLYVKLLRNGVKKMVPINSVRRRARILSYPFC